MAERRPPWRVNLFVTGLAATGRFYEGLGWALEPMGPAAATVDLPGGLSVAFLPAGDPAFVAAFDPDGNRIGLKSPVDDTFRSQPPDVD